MKTRVSILVQMVLLLVLSHLSFSQEVEVNLGGNSTSDAFVVKDTSGNVLLKMDGDKNFGINTEQPDGIEIKGRSTTIEYESGDPIKIIGGSSDDRDGGSVSIIAGSGDSGGDGNGGSIDITSGSGGNGGNIDIKTGANSFESGNINISTANGNSSGDININTGGANGPGNVGGIKLSTGGDGGINYGGIKIITTGDLEAIQLLSGDKISLKTTDDGYSSDILIETGYSYDGANNIYLTVGDGGEYNPRGIILNPNVGLVEIIGSGTYTGTWTQASDERYKNNIEPLKGILNRVNLLQPVKYEWNKEEYPEQNFPDGNQIGLIAQEVEELFPELVATNQGGYKSIDYSKISVLLVQAMKEQQNEMEKQSDEINKMKSEIKELKSMILNNSNKFSSNENLYKEDQQ